MNLTPETTPFRLDEQKNPLPISGPQCTVCKTSHNENAISCPQCGFPVNGQDFEKDKFEREYQVQRASYQGSLQEASKGTNALYWLTGLSLLGGLFVYAASETKEVSGLIVAILVPAIFLGLAQWSKKKPFEALLTALILYLFFILTDAVYEPKTLVQGFILKIVIIGILVRSISAANDARTQWRELVLRHWDQPLD